MLLTFDESGLRMLTFDESGLRILLDASAEVVKMDAPEVDKMDAPEVAEMDAHSKCIRIERCNKPMLGNTFPLMEFYMLRMF
jgi:hypothetical protein